LRDLLRNVSKQIFEEELEGWCTDPAAWPVDRSFDAFATGPG